MKFLNILIIPVILFTSCSEDTWSVQRSESFVKESRNSFSTICLSPQIGYQDKNLNSNTKEIEKLTLDLQKRIIRAADKNRVPMSLKTLNKDSGNDYYEKLLSLKNDLIAANFNSGLYSSGAMLADKLSRTVYVNPPKISYEFNTYSKIFGTKYFSFMEIMIGKNGFTFYHVVVDTDLAETVYNEKKIINRKYNSDLSEQVVYDSFTVLANELKNKR